MNEINKQTLREQMVSIIRERILKGEIEAGARLNETEIAKEFHISRGPVREALRQIEQEGLATYESNRGCCVSVLTQDDITEIYLIRVALEKLAIQIFDGKMSQSTMEELDRIATNIGKGSKEKNLCKVVELDELFHTMIIKESGSKKLMHAWKMYEGSNAAVYYTMNSIEVMPLEYLERNHRFILEALKSEDKDEICQVINQHYMIVPESYKLGKK